MNRFLTWFLVLGVFAGSWSRGLAEDPCSVLLERHAHEHSGHDHDPHQPCDPEHDRNCPVEHHHQGCCGHVMPLVAEPQSTISAGGTAYSRCELHVEDVVAPEDPVHELDKPPLI